MFIDVGNASLILWEGGSSLRRPYVRPHRNGFLDGDCGSPYPAWAQGRASYDVLLTREVFIRGGDLNGGRPPIGVGMGRRLPRCHTRLTHSWSGFGSVGVDIVLRERGSPEVGDTLEKRSHV